MFLVSFSAVRKEARRWREIHRSRRINTFRKKRRAAKPTCSESAQILGALADEYFLFSYFFFRISREFQIPLFMFDGINPTKVAKDVVQAGMCRYGRRDNANDTLGNRGCAWLWLGDNGTQRYYRRGHTT